ncbi:hypothetical protein PSPO01_00368 [Paraphaeosphaeria sporulosa]
MRRHSQQQRISDMRAYHPSMNEMECRDRDTETMERQLCRKSWEGYIRETDSARVLLEHAASLSRRIEDDICPLQAVQGILQRMGLVPRPPQLDVEDHNPETRMTEAPVAG